MNVVIRGPRTAAIEAVSSALAGEGWIDHDEQARIAVEALGIEYEFHNYDTAPGGYPVFRIKSFEGPSE